MNRRSFFGAVGKGAVVAAAALTLTPSEANAATVTPAEGLSALAQGPAGTRHFAVLFNLSGHPVRCMMVNNLPQEIHFISDTRTKPLVFRLVSTDRYDGRHVEGLARYIQFDGACDWTPIKLGF